MIISISILWNQAWNCTKGLEILLEDTTTENIKELTIKNQKI